MKPIIEVHNLRKVYEYYRKQPGVWNTVKSLWRREKLYTEAVAGISFDIQEGELVGFLGPNGAGKTTTLKMLSGILYPTSGEARVLGYIPWERKRDFQKQFSLVMGQKNQLWWDLPAMETFLLHKEIYEIPDRQFQETLDELVTLLEIKDILDIQVRKLSLGQRMKAELTAALLHRPRILFLDEPTIGLDVVSQQNMREFVKTYNERTRTTILLTSHYMEDVERLCKRVIIVHQGAVMYDGSLGKLIDTHVDYKILRIHFAREVARADLSRWGTVKEYHPLRVTLEVPKGKVKEVAAALFSALPIEDITIQEEDLDEVIRTVFSSAS